jgi:triosephosphate isomerase (TIM)
MNRVPLIVGNWKMHKTTHEAIKFISALSNEIAATMRRVFLAVPFTAIEGSVGAVKGTRISIGGQNMHDQVDGAFTGEISARMLKASGATFVILGHSERRQHFIETDSFIHRKLMRALQEGLTPILCVGEMPHERESGDFEKIIKLQLEEAFQGVTQSQATQILIAYEPIWAIGTGMTATPEIAQNMHRFIRNWLESRFGVDVSEKICLLYGGSVKPDNIKALMQQTDIDGVLVGGASLDVKSFAQIVNY